MIKQLICTLMCMCMVVIGVSVPAFASDFEVKNLTIKWDYDPPPDLARYDVHCTDRDEDITVIPLDQVQTYDDQTTPDIPSWTWTGDVMVTTGKTTCVMRAVDLAEQTSEWSDPFTRDYIPGKVIILDITDASGN